MCAERATAGCIRDEDLDYLRMGYRLRRDILFWSLTRG